MGGLLVLGAVIALLLMDSDKTTAIKQFKERKDERNERIHDESASVRSSILGGGQFSGTTGNRRSGLKRKPLRRTVTEEFAEETKKADVRSESSTESEKEDSSKEDSSKEASL